MEANEKTIIEDFYVKQKKIIEEKEIGDKYCVIINTTHPNPGSTPINAFIYKTLDDFKSRVLTDIKKVAPTYDINFLVWVFD